MGIYSDHGIEYRIKLKNNKQILVANTKSTDDRLIKSNFYKKREMKWLSNCSNNFVRILPASDLIELDFDLTNNEKIELTKLLNENIDKVESHGWYDVCYVSDTYGDKKSDDEYDKSKSGYFVMLKDDKKIKISNSEILNDNEREILKSTLNVYDDNVISHGFNKELKNQI
jgi:hypothetical protein